MKQTYVGVIGFDGGGNKLESRHTNPADFLVISDWLQSVIEFHRGELNYNPDCEWHTITVSIYTNDENLYTPKAEPIYTTTLKSLYRH